MAYTINVDVSSPVITAQSTSQAVTVTVENQTFTVTNTVQSFTVNTTVTDVSFYSDSLRVQIESFSDYFKGEWVNGREYARGDLVNYDYDLYATINATGTTFVSTVAPPSQPANWVRVVWHEAPFDQLTATVANIQTLTVNTMSGFSSGGINVNGNLRVTGVSTLTGNTNISGNLSVGGNSSVVGTQLVGGFATFNNSATFAGGVSVDTLEIRSLSQTGGLVVGGNATINGALTVANSSTFLSTLTVKDLIVGPVNFNLTTGTYGNIIIASGTGTASWGNISDLVFWNLNDDLRTNGYNIVTGFDVDVPNPQLTLGSGNTANGFKSYLKFYSVPQSTSVGNVEIKGYTTVTNDLSVRGGLRVGNYAFDVPALTVSTAGNVYTYGTVAADGVISSNDNIISSARVSGNEVRSGNSGFTSFINTSAYGLSAFMPSGILFGDGSIQTTAWSNTLTYTLVTATTTRLGGIIIGDTLSATSNGTLNAKRAVSDQHGIVAAGAYLDVNDGVLSVNTTTLANVLAGVIGTSTYVLPQATNSILGGVKVSVSNDNPIDIYSATGILYLRKASTTALGGVKIGNGINIDGDGVISITTNTYVLPIATPSELGGIKVGDYLSINPSTGVLTVNTTTLQAAIEYSLPVATASTLGGIRPLVNGGLSVNPSNGNTRLTTATDTVIGGVKVGPGLVINPETAVLSVTTVGGVSLSEDLITNGYAIAYSTSSQTKLQLNNGNLYLYAYNDDYLRISDSEVKLMLADKGYTMNASNLRLDFYGSTSSFVLTANTATISSVQKVEINAPVAVVGSDLYNSELRVEDITNFNGVGPPTFPYGIQMPDNSVQITAFYGYDLGGFPISPP